ncbi:MAG: glycosyl hydrolase family 18 protein [Ignavibacteriales bacterium]
MGRLFSGTGRRRMAVVLLLTGALVCAGAAGLLPGVGVRRASAATRTYVVKKGDTLSGIARRYGTTVRQIQAWNGMKGTLIRIGQRLVVGNSATPAASNDPRLLHQVRQGETLEGLAQRYGVTPGEIEAANPGKKVAAGTTLVMPYQSLPVQPVARPSGLPARLIGGYYVKSSVDDALASSTVKEYGDSLDLVIFASHRIRADGSVDGVVYPDQVEAAERNQGKYLIMFTNLNGGRFDRDLVHGVLRSPDLRKRAVASILDTVVREKAIGADIDFESVPPEDRRYFSQFMRELADALHPQGLIVTASVPAKLREDVTQGWSGAFDYPLLARICDLMFVMAYDQHYSTGYAGPVAGIDWVKAVVDYATTAVPAEKLVVGAPAYGYDWRVGSRGARAVPAFRALEIASSRGVEVSRHSEGRVPFFNYKEGRVNRVVYFEDAESLVYKLDLVETLGLRGIVLWRLGYEDPRIWDVIAMRP